MTTKARKKPQKCKASSKSSTKTFAKLREEMNLTESVVPHSHDPMNCASETHSSYLLLLQCSCVLLFPFLKNASLFISPVLSSTAVQGPTISISSLEPGSPPPRANLNVKS